MNPKEVLNELKWHPKKSLNSVVITFIHRGAEGDRKTILGREILSIGNSFFSYTSENRETYIPYHRIVEIRNDNVVLWSKKGDINHI